MHGLANATETDRRCRVTSRRSTNWWRSVSDWSDQGSMAAGDWLTVEYIHDGCSYLQRHIRVSVGKTIAIVTLQCHSEVFAVVESTQRLLAEAILPETG